VALVTLPVGANAIDLVVNVGLAASTNSVTVTVLTTSQAIQQLSSAVNGSAVRNPQPLAAALSIAAASITRGNLVAAANQLGAFQHTVQSQITDPDLARQFIGAAQQVIDALGIVRR
jgi:ABC-type spermidine/putrescine transport system permease subunit II